MTHDDVKTMAADLQRELGDWMLGQLSDAGLRDALWDLYPPFGDLPADEQEALFAAIHQELFG